MPSPSQAIEMLTGLLKGSAATPVIAPARSAPSAIYDLDYRTAVIAIVFDNFSKSFGLPGHRRIATAKLKLLQFVTLRPWLLSAMREWSEGSDQGSLELTHSVRIRRGFLSDTAHDDVINFLVACGIFAREGSHLTTGAKGGALSDIADEIRDEGLFESERLAVSELIDIKLTNSMLEGW